MSSPRDSDLVGAGLGPDGVRGFRAAMRHKPSRSPELILPDEEAAARMGTTGLLEYRRGVLVAQHRWRERIAAGVAARTLRSGHDAIPRDVETPEQTIVRAIAAVEGFGHPDPVLVHRTALSVATHDVGYLERDVVTFFHADGTNGILAPTHPTVVVHDGRVWTSVEALYQAQKHSDPMMRERIRTAPDALTAKRIAREKESDLWSMRSHFGIGRRIAMIRAQMLRASQDASFRAALGATIGRDIVEHTTGDGLDTRWGVVGTRALRGWNLQGRILERVRDALIPDAVPGPAVA